MYVRVQTWGFLQVYCRLVIKPKLADRIFLFRHFPIVVSNVKQASQMVPLTLALPHVACAILHGH